MLFSAWSMGHFGPFTFPGSLDRACRHPCSWSDHPRAVIDAHRAFVRLRLSYIFGADKDAPVMPADCDPPSELVALTRLARRVASLPGALAFFNPNGEVLLSPAELDEAVDFAEQHERLPIEAWTSVRSKIPASAASWE